MRLAYRLGTWWGTVWDNPYQLKNLRSRASVYFFKAAVLVVLFLVPALVLFALVVGLITIALLVPDEQKLKLFKELVAVLNSSPDVIEAQWSTALETVLAVEKTLIWLLLVGTPTLCFIIQAIVRNAVNGVYWLKKANELGMYDRKEFPFSFAQEDSGIGEALQGLAAAPKQDPTLLIVLIFICGVLLQLLFVPVIAFSPASQRMFSELFFDTIIGGAWLYCGTKGVRSSPQTRSAKVASWIGVLLGLFMIVTILTQLAMWIAR